MDVKMLSTCFPKLLASLPSTTQACVHAVHGFWLVGELVELANGPPGGGEVWVFICLELGVIRSTVLRKAERREGLDQT
jgi:hypothetical protein